MRKEKIMSQKKKYETRVTMKDTILALFRSAMVRIEATVKMFSVRKSEYNPTAYNDVMMTLVSNRDGAKR